MKVCFKCSKEKDLDDFYRHSQMADGHLNKCKECTRKDVNAYRVNHPDVVSATDKRRSAKPERKKKQMMYLKTRRAKSPEKDRARRILNYHVRVGNITKKPCMICGDPKTEGHHVDYMKPLDVQWLCFRHHREYGHGQMAGAQHHNNSDPFGFSHRGPDEITMIIDPKGFADLMEDYQSDAMTSEIILCSE